MNNLDYFPRANNNAPCIGKLRSMHHDVYTDLHILNEMKHTVGIHFYWGFSRSLSSNQMWINLYDKSLKPEVRGGAAGGIFENKTHLFVAFGSGLKKYSDVYSYDVTQRSWYKGMMSHVFNFIVCNVYIYICFFVCLKELPDTLLRFSRKKPRFLIKHIYLEPSICFLEKPERF
jgi:hypothetical protein